LEKLIEKIHELPEIRIDVSMGLERGKYIQVLNKGVDFGPSAFFKNDMDGRYWLEVRNRSF